MIKCEHFDTLHWSNWSNSAPTTTASYRLAPPLINDYPPIWLGVWVARSFHTRIPPRHLKLLDYRVPVYISRLAAISCGSIIKWSYHAGPLEGYIRRAAPLESKHPGRGMRRCFQRHHLMCSTAIVMQARRNPHSWALCLLVGRIQTRNAKRVTSPRPQIRYPESSGRLGISHLVMLCLVPPKSMHLFIPFIVSIVKMNFNI